MKVSKARKIFLICNHIFILCLTIFCFLPILNVLAQSFSSSSAITMNKVTLWPVDFTTEAYEFVMKDVRFWTSVKVTLQRVILGVPLNLIMVMLAAYPLSKKSSVFPTRKYYVVYFVFLMIFNGGLIPTYYVITKLGLIDTIWALVLPCSVPIFSVILMMNFFRGIPEELEESARLDGASEMQTLLKIYLPLSKPSVATVTLFSLISHWNSWFDGLIYSNFTENYPMQSYMQTQVLDIDKFLMENNIEAYLQTLLVNNKNMEAAQLFISIVPLMLIYPFCQKYFTQGLTVGSVKG